MRNLSFFGQTTRVIKCRLITESFRDRWPVYRIMGHWLAFSGDRLPSLYLLNYESVQFVRVDIISDVMLIFNQVLGSGGR